MKALLLALALGASWHTDRPGPVGAIAFTATTDATIVARIDVDDLGEGVRYATWTIEHYHMPNYTNVRGSAILHGAGQLALSTEGLEYPETVVAWLIDGEAYAVK